MRRIIVLASSSRYRQELLARLRLPFATDIPDVDESAQPGESHAQTAERLSLLKARTVAQRHPDAIVIGSDQVAELDGAALGKPGTHERARAQLQAMSGRVVRFHSALALVDARDGRSRCACVLTEVRMRLLADEAIERYLRADTPYDCAGSARIESLGISIVESVRSDDPTALIGLPLIALTSLLREFGVDVPAGDGERP